MDKNTETINEQQVHENPLLAMTVEPHGESELKNYLVEYVGTKLDNEEVTVNMISEVLAAEFPEFVFAFAEENFLRGYQLGLDDAENLYREQTETTNEPTG
tara:strand:- start:445 stop:747 length:303 start_codon:yes stop_codon:yes gene_type:complete